MKIDSLDGMIAAIALMHGCNVIVTRNVKHFESVEMKYTVSLIVNESDGDTDTMTMGDYITVIRVN